MKRTLYLLSFVLVSATTWAETSINHENRNVFLARVNNINVSMEDGGNGTYENPLIRADFPDPDVIRVGDTFYMISTTMYHFPGATILMSKDLINWQYCAQPLTKLSDKDNHNLTGGANIYSRGMWASALVYHNDMFYILLNGNDAGCFLLTAKDPKGEWNMRKLDHFYYDAGMLFDDNGMVYVVGGNTNISVYELDSNFNYVREKQIVAGKPGLEGSHFYKFGDYYYVYSTYGGYPSGQTIFRSKNVFGPYEERLLVDKRINGHINTVHQGALFTTPSGQWWTIMQEDLGALGRMPNLQPVIWEDGWPIVGNNGVPYKQYEKPDIAGEKTATPLPTDDNFNGELGMQWQWNHNPKPEAWSLSEHKGWLRLHTTNRVEKLTQAPNTLTQRIFAFDDNPSFGTIRIDVSHLNDGCVAGICIFQDPQALIGVTKDNGKYYIVWQQDSLHPVRNFTPAMERTRIKTKGIVYLRASIDYKTSKTQFYYSLDNKEYIPFGQQTSMFFNLSVFVGARFGLFCYTKDKEGYADFDWFTTDVEYKE